MHHDGNAACNFSCEKNNGSLYLLYGARPALNYQNSNNEHGDFRRIKSNLVGEDAHKIDDLGLNPDRRFILTLSHQK
jgi:hypothetical protein